MQVATGKKGPGQPYRVLHCHTHTHTVKRAYTLTKETPLRKGNSRIPLPSPPPQSIRERSRGHIPRPLFLIIKRRRVRLVELTSTI